MPAARSEPSVSLRAPICAMWGSGAGPDDGTSLNPTVLVGWPILKLWPDSRAAANDRLELHRAKGECPPSP